MYPFPIGSMYGIFTYIYHEIKQMKVNIPYMDPMGLLSLNKFLNIRSFQQLELLDLSSASFPAEARKFLRSRSPN